MTNHNVVSPGTKIEKRLARLAGGLVLVAALTPIVAPAVQAQSVEVRVYDGHHRDYHNWNDREDRAYRRWVAERHYEYREYNRQSARRQRAYWNWRHSHPD
jgi:hypothetical protein